MLKSFPKFIAIWNYRWNGAISSARKDMTFITPEICCNVEDLEDNNALIDTGASCNILPFVALEKLGYGELLANNTKIEFADSSIQKMWRLSIDVVVKVREFYYLTDFYIMGEDTLPSPRY